MSNWDKQNPHYGNEPQYSGAHAMAQEYAHPMFAADAEKSERAAFIQKTYLHLGLAILAFVVLEVIALSVIAPAIGVDRLIATFFSGYNMLILVGAFIGVAFLADMWANSSTSRGMQYLGLGVYVLAESVIFMPILLVADKYFPGAIGTAGIATLAIFGGLTAFVFISKADFSFLRTFLWIGSLAALATIVASMFMGGGLGVWFTGAMILLAAGYILYDTSNVLHKYRTDQYVAASLALFASVALLFWYVLQLVMSMSRD